MLTWEQSCQLHPWASDGTKPASCALFSSASVWDWYPSHLEQQIGIFSIIYCVKNILFYCNKCMQQLLLLFVPAFNYLEGWVGVMVVVLAGQGAQCWVCPCPCPCPHWRAASNTALKLFWNERIKHTFLCWNIFTKHHSLFLTWGRQNEIMAGLPFCYINWRSFARLLMPSALGTHWAPAGKALLICLHTEQQELRGSGVIELKQSA